MEKKPIRVKIVKADPFGGIKIYLGKQNKDKFYRYELFKEGDTYTVIVKEEKVVVESVQSQGNSTQAT